MEYVATQRDVSCVYANLACRTGPTLVHWPDWANRGDVLCLLPLVKDVRLNQAGMYVCRIRVGGSDYRLIYKRDHRVECMTVVPQSTLARPLSPGSAEQPVSYLHFYRPLNQKTWKQLLPGEDVVLPEVVVPKLAQVA